MKQRASSGVQSISTVIFMGAALLSSFSFHLRLARLQRKR
jgi:hypothetical protein